ncbi:MAG TPA: hypothetical protein VLK56_10285 [Solirubrobacterales bacterium]|nr:hypothetical protein [Solirubrobacterales bacterium]
MKGIVAPSSASRTSSIAAAPPVRRALPATPSRTRVLPSLYIAPGMLVAEAYGALTVE